MVDIDSSEVRKLAVDLQRATGTVGAKAARAIRKTASAIERTAKAIAPVDPTNETDLKGSISTDVSGDGRFGSMSAEIGPTVRYGGYVEFGTSDTSPQPFMGPAFDRHAPGLARELGDAGEDVL